MTRDLRVAGLSVKSERNNMSHLEDIALKLMECRQQGLSDEQMSEKLKMPIATIHSYETGIKQAIQKLNTKNYAPSDTGLSLATVCVLAVHYQTQKKETMRVYRSRGEETIERIREAQAQGNTSYSAIAFALDMSYHYIRGVMVKSGMPVVHIKKGGGVQRKDMQGPSITDFHRAEVYRLRREGKKFNEIGDILKITKSWACRLYSIEKSKRE